MVLTASAGSGFSLEMKHAHGPNSRPMGFCPTQPVFGKAVTRFCLVKSCIPNCVGVFRCFKRNVNERERNYRAAHCRCYKPVDS